MSDAAEYDVSDLGLDEEDFNQGPSQAAMGDLSKLADRQMDLEAKVATIEERLKEAKLQLRSVQEDQFPDALSSARVSEFTTDNGLHVKVKNDMKLSITEARREAVHAWLRANDLAGLIKVEVGVLFSKDQEEEAIQLAESLTLKGYTVAQAEKANTSSVKAAVRGMMAEGREVPLQLLGGFETRKTIIKVT